ncbi:hypothetical protein C8F01DRAFT_264106 [Mycena amicta]|nr:hypothetical protein C8F01DRAFT_264106 [Mycena amicta]
MMVLPIVLFKVLSTNMVVFVLTTLYGFRRRANAWASRRLRRRDIDPNYIRDRVESVGRDAGRCATQRLMYPTTSA